MSAKRILRLAKECAEMRRELVQAEDYGDEITVTFSGKELSAVVYGLAVAYISEWVAGENGHRKLMEMMADASATLLAMDAMPQIEEAINRILEEGQDAA